MGCASELSDALVQGGVKNASKIPHNAGRGHVIIEGSFAHSANLSPLAKKVNDAQTPHRDRVKPGLLLEVFTKLDKKSAAAAIEALGKVKGVDAKGTVTNLRVGSLGVRLAGDAKVSVADILAALKTAGLQPRIVTSPEKPKEVEGKSEEKK